MDLCGMLRGRPPSTQSGRNLPSVRPMDEGGLKGCKLEPVATGLSILCRCEEVAGGFHLSVGLALPCRDSAARHLFCSCRHSQHDPEGVGKDSVLEYCKADGMGASSAMKSQHRFLGGYWREESGKSRISRLLAQAASGSFQCLVRTRAKPPFSRHAEIARGAASRAAAR